MKAIKQKENGRLGSQAILTMHLLLQKTIATRQETARPGFSGKEGVNKCTKATQPTS